MDIPDRVRRAIAAYTGAGGSWYVNWPFNSPRDLGEKGQFVGAGFVFGSHSSLPFQIDPRRVDRDSWEYLDADGSTVEMGVDASAPGWEFIGSSSAGIKADFASDRSVYLSASHSYIERIANIDGLKLVLAEVAGLPDYPTGTAVVVERMVAEKALLLVAKTSKASMRASASGDATVTPGVKASVAGHLNVVGTSSGIDIEQYGSTPVVLAFRAVILTRKGWLWWQRVRAVGFGPREGFDMLELTSTDEDVFVELPARLK